MNSNRNVIVSHGPSVLEHHLNFSGFHNLHSLENEPTGATGSKGTADLSREKLGTDGLYALMEAHRQWPGSSVYLLYIVPPRVSYCLQKVPVGSSLMPLACSIPEEERTSGDTFRAHCF